MAPRPRGHSIHDRIKPRHRDRDRQHCWPAACWRPAASCRANPETGRHPRSPFTPAPDIKVEEPTSKQPRRTVEAKRRCSIRTAGWPDRWSIPPTARRSSSAAPTATSGRTTWPTWKQLWEHRARGVRRGRRRAGREEHRARLSRTRPAAGIRFLDARRQGRATLEEEACPDRRRARAVCGQLLPGRGVDGWRGADRLTSRKVIFGNCGEYVVKTWGGREAIHDQVEPGRSREGTRRRIRGAPGGGPERQARRRDRGRRPGHGKNVLWAWAAGSGAGNHLLEGHKEVVVAAAWSKDGKTIVTGDADGVVITWDAATFKEKSRLALGGRVAAVAISADGKHMRPRPCGARPARASGRARRRSVRLAGREPAGEARNQSPSTRRARRSRESRRSPSRRTASRSCPRSATSSTSPGSANSPARCASSRWQVNNQNRVRSRATSPTYNISPDGKHYAVSPGVTVHDATGKTLYKVTGEAAGFSADGKTLFVMGKKVIRVRRGDGEDPQGTPAAEDESGLAPRFLFTRRQAVCRALRVRRPRLRHRNRLRADTA